jgi:hypothetical protein
VSPELVPLLCQSCGEQVGLRSPGPEPDPATVVVRCYACRDAELAEGEGATVIALPVGGRRLP